LLGVPPYLLGVPPYLPGVPPFLPGVCTAMIQIPTYLPRQKPAK
jgi:hypothetical protein